MASIGFASVATQKAFDNISDKLSSKLYFVIDSQRLYKGDIDITQSIVIVDGFPDTPGNNIFDNKIYINRHTQEFRIKYGDDWIVIVPEKVTVGTEVTPANANKIPTVNAILEYVDSIVSVVGVTDVTYNKTSGTLSVTDTGVTTETEFTGVAHNVEIDSAAATVKIPMFGLPSIEVDLSGLDGLRSVNYVPDYEFEDHTTGPAVVITLGRFGLPDIEYAFDPSPFIDIYRAQNTSTVMMNVEDKYIYATVRVSSEQGNRIKVKEDGLYVDVSDKADKLTSGEFNTNDILIANNEGNIYSSHVSINQSDELTNSTDKVPSDMTVLKAISWKTI